MSGCLVPAYAGCPHEFRRRVVLRRDGEDVERELCYECRRMVDELMTSVRIVEEWA